MKTDTLVLLFIVLEYLLLFLDDGVIKNMNNYQIEKVLSQCDA